MSAPVLWFFLPFLFGSLSMLFSEKRKLITILAIILCLFLAFVASLFVKETFPQNAACAGRDNPEGV